jgi:hypothetical protein
VKRILLGEFKTSFFGILLGVPREVGEGGGTELCVLGEFYWVPPMVYGWVGLSPNGRGSYPKNNL